MQFVHSSEVPMFQTPQSQTMSTTLNEEVLLPLLEERDKELFQYPHTCTRLGNIQAFTTHSGTRSATSHFTVTCYWGCTMSVWHVWGKGPEHHHLHPLPLHLSLPHSPPKPEWQYRNYYSDKVLFKRLFFTQHKCLRKFSPKWLSSGVQHNIVWHTLTNNTRLHSVTPQKTWPWESQISLHLANITL
jgi:hypothetical protein